MKLTLHGICLLLSGAILAAAEMPREWTSVDGKKMEAVMRNASTKDVTLLPTGGQRVVVPLTQLSQSDRDYVTQKAAANAQSFSLEIVGNKIVTREAFFRSGPVNGSITVKNPEGTSMIAVPTDVIVEVKAKMLPPKVAGGNQTLEFANLRIVHRKRDKTEATETAGPRWQSGVKGQGPPERIPKPGIAGAGKPIAVTVNADSQTPKALTIQDGKPIEFSVAFAIPKDSTALALTYEGAPMLEVPLR